MIESDFEAKDYDGTLLAKNAGSLGIEGELLKSIRQHFEGEKQKTKEIKPFTYEHALIIVARGIALRSSRPEKLEEEHENGINGDALATYNLGFYTDQNIDNWDLQDQVNEGNENLSSLNIQEYLAAIKTHFKFSLAIDLGKVFTKNDTFESVFEDIPQLLNILPVIHVLELGQYPPIPDKLDSYFSLGNLGADEYFAPEQISSTAQLSAEELQAIWNDLKPTLAGVKLVDDTLENKNWGQEIVFEALINKYLEKIIDFLDSLAMPDKENEPSAELILAVKAAVEAATGVDFEVFFSAYLEKNADQPDLTEADLVAEILEAGGYQTEDDATFEDSVMIGAFAMGEDLEIFNH